MTQIMFKCVLTILPSVSYGKARLRSREKRWKEFIILLLTPPYRETVPDAGYSGEATGRTLGRGRK